MKRFYISPQTGQHRHPVFTVEYMSWGEPVYNEDGQ